MHVGLFAAACARAVFFQWKILVSSGLRAIREQPQVKRRLAARHANAICDTQSCFADKENKVTSFPRRKFLTEHNATLRCDLVGGPTICEARSLFDAPVTSMHSHAATRISQTSP